MVTSALLPNQRAGRHSISMVTSGVGRVESRIFTDILKRARALAILASYFKNEISVEVGYHNPPYSRAAHH